MQILSIAFFMKYNGYSSIFLYHSVSHVLKTNNHIIIFSSEIRSQISMVGLNDQVSGRWFTANASIISVDTLSGIAEAVGEGSTQGNE